MCVSKEENNSLSSFPSRCFGSFNTHMTHTNVACKGENPRPPQPHLLLTYFFTKKREQVENQVNSTKVEEKKGQMVSHCFFYIFGLIAYFNLIYFNIDRNEMIGWFIHQGKNDAFCLALFFVKYFSIPFSSTLLGWKICLRRPDCAIFSCSRIFRLQKNSLHWNMFIQLGNSWNATSR